MFRWWARRSRDSERGTTGDGIEDAFRRAIERHEAGDRQGAGEFCDRVLSRLPDHPGALYLLGEIAALEQRPEEAEGYLLRALKAAPNDARTLFVLGCVQSERGAPDRAEASWRRAIAADAAHAASRLNLGCLLQARGESVEAADGERLLDEALEHLSAATRAEPGNPDAWTNLGYSLARKRRLMDAEEAYDRALQLDPGHSLARFNRSMVLLGQQKFRQGWRDYEARWAASGFARPSFAGRPWEGGELAGRRLLLYTEQGYGDAIQFVRYAAELDRRGAHVELACPAPLARLMAGARGVRAVHPVEGPAAPCDLHGPLMSVPNCLEAAGILEENAYLCAAPEISAAWAERVPDAGALRVGLVWESRSAFPGAGLKSVPARRLAALQGIANVDFYSVQVGAGTDVPLPLHDHTRALSDFAETAGLLSCMDLVVSVDTAVAHLAGAMGKPVWILLPYAADWRWEPDFERNAWYPSARLFRQRRRGDWAEVISRVAAALRTEAAQPRRASSRT